MNLFLHDESRECVMNDRKDFDRMWEGRPPTWFLFSIGAVALLVLGLCLDVMAR
jgi:hypothetical protein